jgi:gamma-glutamyltranspeptidase/glutathione hydrolase
MGLEEAHRRFATRSWADLVSPAIEVARAGVECDEARLFLHGILAPILLHQEAGRRIYGDVSRVRTSDLVPTLERVRDIRSGAVAEIVPEFADDLRSYRVSSPAPLSTTILGRRILSMPPPSLGGAVVEGILEVLAVTAAPTLEDEARAVALAYGGSGLGPLTGTTHVSVIDGTGMAAALSSTLGSGSGLFRAGTQLNNMLGELDVIGPGEHLPGERLASMMTPTLVLEDGRPRLVIGSAGSVRLAGAIAQVTWRFLQGTHVADAINAPRLHVDGATVHLEGGFTAAEAETLDADWNVVRWEGVNLFFGGVQAVELTADGLLDAAGDPRRGGVGLVVE